MNSLTSEVNEYIVQTIAMYLKYDIGNQRQKNLVFSSQVIMCSPIITDEKVTFEGIIK